MLQVGPAAHLWVKSARKLCGNPQILMGGGGGGVRPSPPPDHQTALGGGLTPLSCSRPTSKAVQFPAHPQVQGQGGWKDGIQLVHSGDYVAAAKVFIRVWRPGLPPACCPVTRPNL